MQSQPQEEQTQTGPEMLVAYCERINFGAEPLNTLSNIAFVLPVAVGFFLLYRQSVWHKTAQCAGRGQGHAEVAQQPASPHYFDVSMAQQMLLILLPLCIGVGSALFHSQPSRLTQTLDIFPIALFALLSAWILLRKACLKPGSITLVLTIWLTTSALAGLWPQLLAGSLFYLPTVLLLWFCCLNFSKLKKPLLPIATLFSISLILRSLDLPLCSNGSGTHALWHGLTALTCTALIHTCLPNKDTH